MNKTPIYFCILRSYERLAKLKSKKLEYEILKMTKQFIIRIRKN
jgi:hypothetical protein